MPAYLALSGKGVAVLTSVGSGPTPCESLASYVPASQSWRTHGQSSLWTEEPHSGEFSESLPNSGMTCSGTLYPLRPLVAGIDARESGYWLPTPIARDWKDTPGMAKKTQERSRDDTLPRRIYVLEKSPGRSGIINPAFSLWLMGYPAGWLKLS